MKYLSAGIFLFICSGFVQAKRTPPFFLQTTDAKVDSVLKSMSIDQKIGQLFMIQAYSNGKGQPIEEILESIANYEVGGIIFMQGAPYRQVTICNRLQKASKIPLLMATDAENGLSFRLDSTASYPFAMTLGAITDDSLIYQMGFEIGQQCRATGIHMNMAPVSDINNNAANPIINHRSFGEDRKEVARKSWLYAKGMQDAGVIATAKHFPGHGDTDTDSHQNLPMIAQTKSQLDSLELYPFNYLIQQGIPAIMTGHLQVPALESNSRIPASLSKAVITTKLKNQMGFEGLVITDAMNMKGVANLYSSAESSVMALKAGNDMLEIVPRLDRAVAAVKLAVKKGELTEAEIDSKCRKIIAIKIWLGLFKDRMIQPENLSQTLKSPRFMLTSRLLHEKSLTVLKNEQNLLPLSRPDTLKAASLIIGSAQPAPFQSMLGNYSDIDHFQIGKTPTESEVNALIDQLKPYNLLIVGLSGMSMYPAKRFGITDQQISILQKIEARNVILCFFGNPYALVNFPSVKNAQTLILTYQDNTNAQELAAQLIFGAVDASGKLPVSVPEMFPAGTGIRLKSVKRLKYTLPEEVDVNSFFLKTKIDSLANLGIEKKAFPGCQVLIAKSGKVIFRKSYGKMTYEGTDSITNDQLYDLASVTKVAASVPAVMKLFDEKKIDLDQPLSSYLREFKNTGKSGITLRDILTHQARLQSGLPFWFAPGSYTKIREGVFKNQPTERYSIRISSGMYARNDFREQMINEIIKSPLRATKEFHYSDLGFSLLPDIAERLTDQKFDDYLSQTLYKKIGASTLMFKPYENFPLSRIVPTEDDQVFRKELLQGFVHDETAALMGGVSGNAGLFGSANDLAKIMQLILQNGYYGGQQLIDSTTVQFFTKTQFPLSGNRRALGFDKPLPAGNGKNKFPAADASPESFGHTGFTGTMVWMDPKCDLLFIFLSNRVYPTRRNSTINTLNIRTEMHQAIYDAIRQNGN